MARRTGHGTPIGAASLQILLSLADAVRHGHAIREDVEARTAGEMVLGPGTLYEAIHRMVRDGWIEEAVEATAADPDGRRRHYRVTGAGRRALEAELLRLDRVVRDARARDLMPKAREA